jgi:hypothetical protein
MLRRDVQLDLCLRDGFHSQVHPTTRDCVSKSQSSRGDKGIERNRNEQNSVEDPVLKG